MPVAASFGHDATFPNLNAKVETFSGYFPSIRLLSKCHLCEGSVLKWMGWRQSVLGAVILERFNREGDAGRVKHRQVHENQPWGSIFFFISSTPGIRVVAATGVSTMLPSRESLCNVRLLNFIRHGSDLALKSATVGFCNVIVRQVCIRSPAPFLSCPRLPPTWNGVL